MPVTQQRESCNDSEVIDKTVMVVITKQYTLTGEYCKQCEVPLAEELDGNKQKCKLCRK